MKAGDRVWLVEDIEQHNRIVVGTVKSVSAAGYVRVWWDQVYPVSHFSPASGTTRLKVVTGEDALPRHDWDCQKNQIDPPCLSCGAIQTDANEHAPCASHSSSDRLKYNAINSSPLIMQAFDDLTHCAKRETKQKVAELERKNRKRI